MKALSLVISIVLLLVAFPQASGAQLQYENEWKYNRVQICPIDSLKTRNYVTRQGQTFELAGWTVQTDGEYGVQTICNKRQNPQLSAADKYFVTVRVSEWQYGSVDSAFVWIAVQRDNPIGWKSFPRQRVPLNGGSYTLEWDASSIDKEVKLDLFYIYVRLVGKDSGEYLWAKVEFSNLGRVDSTKSEFFDFMTTSTGVKDPDGIKVLPKQSPKVFELSQNYPNPFNPTTKIQFSVPSGKTGSLVIYDVMGREIQKLVPSVGAGSYEVDFNASNLPSGMYFCQLTVGGSQRTVKMVLSK